MRSLLSTLGEVVGFAAVSVGFWRVDPSAGLIAAGVAVVALSFAAGDG